MSTFEKNLLYIVGMLVAYLMIGYANDKMPDHKTKYPFAFVFLSWLIIIIGIIFSLIDWAFTMEPPGMQSTHLHKIPKGDRIMGSRISLTYRAWRKDL